LARVAPLGAPPSVLDHDARSSHLSSWDQRLRGGSPARRIAMSLAVVPIFRDEAMAFISAHHRHHGRPQGYLFALAAAENDTVVGVAVVGRPVSRMLQDGGDSPLHDGREERVQHALRRGMARGSSSGVSPAGHVHVARGGRRVTASCRLEVRWRGRRWIVVGAVATARGQTSNSGEDAMGNRNMSLRTTSDQPVKP
jgi:hypothetical protein